MFSQLPPGATAEGNPPMHERGTEQHGRLFIGKPNHHVTFLPESGAPNDENTRGHCRLVEKLCLPTVLGSRSKSRPPDGRWSPRSVPHSGCPSYCEHPR